MILLSNYNNFAQNSKIILKSPSSGEEIRINKNYEITWFSFNVSSVIIELSSDNGENWTTVTSEVSAFPTEYLWNVKVEKLGKYLLKIKDAKNPLLMDQKEINVVPLNNLTPNLTSEKKVLSNTIKIMPLGNSITRGVTGSSTLSGYRQYLYSLLINDGYDIDFIGSLSDGDFTVADKDHEGHSGWHARHPTLTTLSIADNLLGWLNLNPPNLILLHVGSNDISNLEAFGEVVSDVTEDVGIILDIIENYEVSNSIEVITVIAKIINREDDPMTTLDENLATSQFNSQLEGLVNSRIISGSRLVLVDMENALDYQTDLSDGLHPNDSGYEKMAQVWYSALVNTISHPKIISQPTSQGAIEGQVANFSIEASGVGDITYQWRKNGVEILGATSKDYTTASTTLSDNNNIYTCIASNFIGDQSSKSAVLYVTPSNKRVTTSQISSYFFDEGNGDLIDDYYGDVQKRMIIENSSSVEWIQNGLNINEPVKIKTSVPQGAIVDSCISTNELAIEAWIKPGNLVQTGPSRIISYSLDGNNRNFTLSQDSANINVRLRTNLTNDNGTPATNTLNSPLLRELTHIVFTRNYNGVTKIFINGNLITSNYVYGDFSNWNSSYLLGIANEITVERPWQGAIYYTSIYNRALTQAEVQHNFSFGVPRLSAPSNLIADLTKDGMVSLEWEDNSNSETGFIIERSQNDTIIYNQIDTVDYNVIIYKDSTVEELTNYYYRIKSVKNLTESAPTSIFEIRTSLRAPTQVTVEINNFGFPQLKWTDNSDVENGTIIERRKSDSINFLTVDTLIANEVLYNDATVNSFTSYDYRISSFKDDQRSNFSDTIRVDVLVDYESLNIPEEFELFQNYPNPFNPTTTIKYILPVLSWAQINLFNILGEKVLTLVDDKVESGYHQVILNASKLNSGVYFYVLETRGINSEINFRKVKKLIILK